MTALIVYKKSTYELYKYSSDAEVQTYMKREETNVQEMMRSHEEQQRTLETITTDLDWLQIPHKEIYRADLQQENLSPYHLLISVGGDGTLLELSHYVHRVDLPVLGVNSDPQRSTGFFCSANRENFRFLMQGITQETTTQLHRLQLQQNGVALPELVLNDV
ncbi:MAG: NAD(+)/NADH kinase, partial [Nanoarchaeota archaeon]|nr:NAD(+)/NADH kinase [Nanoarchaeota archaeon]